MIAEPNPVSDPGGLLSMEEAAELAGVTTSAVAKWGTSGELEKVRVGRRVFFTRPSVEHYLVKRRTTAAGRRNAWAARASKKRKRSARSVIEQNLVQVDALLSEVRKELVRYEREARVDAVAQVRKQLARALA